MTEPRTGTTANILAGFASFLCAGLGQLLQARPGPAVLHFIFAVLLWLIWLGWVVHFYSAYDAATWEPSSKPRSRPAPRPAAPRPVQEPLRFEFDQPPERSGGFDVAVKFAAFLVALAVALLVINQNLPPGGKLVDLWAENFVQPQELPESPSAPRQIQDEPQHVVTPPTPAPAPAPAAAVPEQPSDKARACEPGYRIAGRSPVCLICTRDGTTRIFQSACPAGWHPAGRLEP